MMKMMDCPKWHSCSAPICPFWEGGIHRKDEPVCLYLREFYKANAEENFERAGVGHIYTDLKELAPKVVASSRHIRKEVERASKTNSRLTRSKSKKDDAEKGLNGTVIGLGVGKGITQDRYNSIPPLPEAGNAIDEASLSGDRNRCPTCLEKFNSSKAFGQHRTGKFNGKRRCLTIGEMETKGFRKNRDGFWLSPVSEKDRERLAEIRRGSEKSGLSNQETACNSELQLLSLADG